MDINLNCNNKKNLDEIEQLLSNTFLLDMDTIKNKLENLKKSDNLLNDIHLICMQHLENYYLDAKQYFRYEENTPSSYEYYINHLKTQMSLYLIENAILSLYLSNVDTDQTISFELSAKNYYNKNSNDTKKYRVKVSPVISVPLSKSLSKLINFTKI